MTKCTTGWAEWADKRVSLYRGCTNGCRYCFARANALRFKLVRTLGEWATPMLNMREARRTWGKCRHVIGFPATHDITTANMRECSEYLYQMLRAGNRVLIVTKPDRDAVDYLCRDLVTWKEQVEWRMTITGTSLGPWRYWEPNAPTPQDRIRALRIAIEADWRTSVSMEPMIDWTHGPALARDLAHMGAETVWIGKMNRIRNCMRIVTDEDRQQVERIEAAQTDERIMEVVRQLSNVPQVRWKDSIQEVIQRNGGTGR